jgi:hypothetical protein
MVIATLRIPRSSRILILLALILIPFILAAGCGGEKTAQTDILIYKLDSSGNINWITKFDSGMQDSGWGILEISNGGYLIYGSVSDNPEGEPGHRTYPLLVLLDSRGTIQWSRILNRTFNNSSSDYGWAASSAIETTGGNIIISTYRENDNLIQIDSNGTVQWIRHSPISIRSSIPTIDGGALFVGNGVIKTDSNGTIQWEKSLEDALNVLQTSDDRYILDHSVISGNPPHSVRVVSCLDTTGNIVWTYEIGETYTNDITSLRETPDRLVEVTLASDRQLTFNRDGKVVVEKNITADGTVTRTSDGGYIYGICLSKKALKTFPLKPTYCGLSTTDFHVIREASDGTFHWDHVLDPPLDHYPQSILQSRDGGFVFLTEESAGPYKK